MSLAKVFFAVFGVISLMIGCSEGEKGDSVAAANPYHDFGRVFQYDELSHELIIDNGTKSSVSIESFAPSCGCTTIDGELIGKTIPGDSSARVPVVFKTGSRQGKQTPIVAVGLVDKKGSQTLLLYEMEAYVDPEIVFSPDMLDFGVVSALAPKSLSKRLRLTPNVSSEFTVSKASIVSKCFETSEVVNCKDGSKFIDVCINTHELPKKAETVSGTLVLEFEGCRLPNKHVIVVARHEAPVTIVPTSFVAIANKSEFQSLRARIQHVSSVQVADFRCEDPRVRLALFDRSYGKDLLIEVATEEAFSASIAFDVVSKAVGSEVADRPRLMTIPVSVVSTNK